VKEGTGKNKQAREQKCARKKHEDDQRRQNKKEYIKNVEEIACGAG
jgi:hypothetical protein